MNEIVLENGYSAKDYRRTRAYLRKLNGPSRIIYLLGGFVVFAVGVIYLLIFLAALDKGEYEKARLMFLGAFAIFLVMIGPTLYFLYLQMQRFKKAVKKLYNPDPTAYTVRWIVIDEKGILEVDTFGRRLTDWKSILGVTETDDDFYLYMETGIRFLPKRWFAEKQLDPLKMLIESNLGKDAECRFQASKN